MRKIGQPLTEPVTYPAIYPTDILIPSSDIVRYVFTTVDSDRITADSTHYTADMSRTPYGT